MKLLDVIPQLNLMCAEARALELLEAWRAGDEARVAEIRAELAGSYGMSGYTEADLGKLVVELIRKGL